MTLSIAAVRDAEAGELAHVEIETKRRRYRYFRCAAEGDWVQNVILGGARPDFAVHVGDVATLSRERLFLLERLDIPLVSATSDDALFRQLDSEDDPPRDVDSPVLLPVETVLSVKGRGTIVSGRIARGLLRRSAEVELVSEVVLVDTVVTTERTKPIPTSIAQIELERRCVDAAGPGDHVFVLLRGIERDQVSRGDVLAAVDSVGCSQTLRGRISLVTERTFALDQSFTFGIHNLRVMGRVRALDDDGITVDLASSVPLPHATPFVVYEGPVLIGIGEIAQLQFVSETASTIA